MIYFLWIPIVTLHYILYAWLSKQNNVHKTWKWFWILFLVGSLGQYWPWISKHSKNLLLDGFLFDLIMISSYVGALIYLGEASEFNKIQWTGVAFALLGIILMKCSWS